MKALSFGRQLRALRRRRRWTQGRLAEAAGVSQSAVSRAERGKAGCLTNDLLDRLVAPLGARVDVRLTWNGEGLDRLVDAEHAVLVEAVVRRLRRTGWETAVEVTFSVYGERGSVDVLGFHPSSGALLVVEVESVVPDLQSMLASLDRKTRLAPTIARERGWAPRSVSTLLVAPDGTTTRRRVAEHAAVFDSRLPLRTVAVNRWIAAPSGSIAGILFLSRPAASAGAPSARRLSPPSHRAGS